MNAITATAMMTLREFIDHYKATHLACPFRLTHAGFIRTADGYDPICAVAKKLGKNLLNRKIEAVTVGLILGLKEDDVQRLELASDLRCGDGEQFDDVNKLRDELLKLAELKEIESKLQVV